jgi:hypothetical protein
LRRDDDSTWFADVLRARPLPSILAVATLAAAVCFAPSALAYRPFDGTDGDTAELGTFELELGPVHYYRQGSQRYVITPATVFNFGVMEGTEIVIDAQQYVALGQRQPGVPRYELYEDDILLKHVFREGVLQGKSGLSIAAEGGLLTPQVNGTGSVGASIDVIGSYRWSFGTLHWNEWFQYTREHYADLYTGVILEGPFDWKVRPVAELYYEKDWGAGITESGLVGAIWTLQDSFILDAAVRQAYTVGEWATEVRLGFTWTLTMWETKEKEEEPKKSGAGAS